MKNIDLLKLLIEELLNEPDETTEEAQEEISASGIPGVMTPLGTGPDGGKGKKDKKSNPRARAISANMKAFGGGKLAG